MAALAGLSTLIVELEGRSGIGALFGREDPLTYAEVLLSPGAPPGGRADDGGLGDVRARTVTPDEALLEYLEGHGMARISRRLTSSGALDVVATAVPGIREILVLGKLKQLERADDADLIVLDAPAAGHALTLLTSARGLLDAARVGPIRAQAEDVVALLTEPGRCQVLLVTLPEETPVNEVVETADRLEDRVGVKLAPVVVNGLYPRLAGLDADPAELAREAGVDLAPEQCQALQEAARFRARRQDLQAEQVARLRTSLPLAQLHLPFLFTPDIGLAELDVLAAALAAEVWAL